MTKSEIQCTNYIIDFFFKEFVYRNLYFYESKQKLELCDGLIEFQDSYVIFQIKEKDTSTSHFIQHFFASQGCSRRFSRISKNFCE